MARIMPPVRVTVVTGYLGAGKSSIAAGLRELRPSDEIAETDGLAHPADAAPFDDLVCAVDAKHAVFHLDDSAVCRAQIEAAGAIVLTKTDLVAEPDTRRLERRLRGMNPGARVVHSADGAVEAGHAEIPPGASGEPGVERITFEEDPLERALLEEWLDRLAIEHGPELYRLKGVAAAAGEERRLVVDGVHMTIGLQPGDPWDGEPPRTRLELTGRHLREAVRPPGER